VYGNYWITAWTIEWPPDASAESATGAPVHAISPEWPEGVEPGCTPPRPHLRADSEGGRISIWRSPLLELFWEPRTWVKSLFHCSFVKHNNLSGPIPVYLFILQSVYLFALQVGCNTLLIGTALLRLHPLVCELSKMPRWALQLHAFETVLAVLLKLVLAGKRESYHRIIESLRLERPLTSSNHQANTTIPLNDVTQCVCNLNKMLKDHFILRSQNHLSWKRQVRSSSPTINPSPPCTFQRETTDAGRNGVRFLP